MVYCSFKESNETSTWCRCDWLTIFITDIIMAACKETSCILMHYLTTWPSLRVNNRCWWEYNTLLWWIAHKIWGHVVLTSNKTSLLLNKGISFDFGEKFQFIFGNFFKQLCQISEVINFVAGALMDQPFSLQLKIKFHYFSKVYSLPCQFNSQRGLPVALEYS